MRIRDAIVVGAGQAGLAAAYHLKRRRLDFAVLDSRRVGESWEQRWDSLRLFTPVRYDALPGLAFPGAPYRLPGKDEVAAYLRDYAHHYALPIREGEGVRAIRGRHGCFEVETTKGETLLAQNVIVATGANQRPYVPSFARAIARRVVQLHSADYRRPSQLPGGRMLVVGAGNSGAQIALELAHGGRPVMLAGPSVGGLPRRWLGRDIYDWIWPTLLRAPPSSVLLKRSARARRFAADPLVGMDSRDFASAGIVRTGRVTGVADCMPTLEDGTRLGDVAAIVWCTGFRPDYAWIELPVLGLDNHPIHDRGLAVGISGLGFVGMRQQRCARSALLGGVGDDAEYVVDRLAER